MTQRAARPLLFLAAIVLVAGATAVVAQPQPAPTVTPVEPLDTAPLETPAETLPAAPEAADGAMCAESAEIQENDPIFLWGPTNPNCPYRVCFTGSSCNSDADCCGAFFGDGYCQHVPEGNNYCVCP